MMLSDQVYAQALLLAGETEPEREQLLKLLCQSAVAELLRRLREGITQEDCRADLIAAGALYALAALEESNPGMERMQFGDVTVVSGGTTAATRCLRRQAELIISPYCAESFAFRRV